ncbi:hypothetical protein RUM43_006624 [Polyplax serrata]|uniref:LIM zinc-binding domain-containing protein n=1 Tax=Polyplax serrata TaxID=468196 RepID=A0AAN8NTM6_POLSC
MADPSADILRNKFAHVTCNNCKQGIEGKIVSALGKTWHPEHFNCSNCKTPITGDRFNQDQGSPYCEECYANIFLKRCYKCNMPIKEKIIVALEQFWHQEHFTCADCHIELTGLSFFEKDNVAYCQNCHMQKFAPKCKGCNRPITDTAIMALGDKWHQNCFVCSQCSRPVTEATFEVVEDRPLCSNCSRQRK